MNDGGPAFPAPAPPWAVSQDEQGVDKFQLAGIQDGMSLRDWFAGMVIQGLLPSDALVLFTDSREGEPIESEIADAAYRGSDAMLKAREESDAPE